MNVHCSQNRLNAVTKLSRMNAGQKNSSQTPKMSAKAASCDDTQDACVRDVALILKFQCRKNKYISAGAQVDKIRLADLLKLHIGVELGPQAGKSFCKRETASFCSRLTPMLQDKKQTDDQNQNIL